MLTEHSVLWMGHIPPWMDEAFLGDVWFLSHARLSKGELVHVKVQRHKMTGLSMGYCFLEFASHERAAQALHLFHGTEIPGSGGCRFLLNWADYSGSEPCFSLFVGHLNRETTEEALSSVFEEYLSCYRVKVVRDRHGISRGFGFAKFRDEEEFQHALATKQGTVVDQHPIVVSKAMPKQSSHNDAVSIFVGGLAPQTTESDLRHHFSMCGEIVGMKLMEKKHCAFIAFSREAEAAAAIVDRQHSLLHERPLRLSWGQPKRPFY